MKHSTFRLFYFISFLTFVSGVANAQIYNPNQYSNPVIQKMYYSQLMTTKAIGGLIQGHMIKAGVKCGKRKNGKAADNGGESRSPEISSCRSYRHQRC